MKRQNYHFNRMLQTIRSKTYFKINDVIMDNDIDVNGWLANNFMLDNDNVSKYKKSYTIRNHTDNKFNGVWLHPTVTMSFARHICNDFDLWCMYNLNTNNINYGVMVDCFERFIKSSIKREIPNENH